MLGIEDIRNVSFRKATFGGYKPEDVDAFIDDIQISYEKILRERENLLTSVEGLKNKVNKFYEEEDSIKNVILNAQKISEKSLNDAKIKTTGMIDEATKKSEKIINEAKKEASVQAEISSKLKLETARLRKELEDIYKKHLNLINSMSNENPDAEKAEESNLANKVTTEEVTESRIFETERKDNNKDINFEEVNLGEIQPGPNDIFSSDNVNIPQRRKFENLKFGKDYSEKKENETSGAYSGIFRKKK